MNKFKDLLSEKENAAVDKNEALPELASEYFDKARQIADIVTSGLEHENYSDINKQLAEFAKDDISNEIFVFNHPNNFGEITATVVFAIISLIWLYFLFISIGTLIFSVKLFIYGLIGIIASVAILTLNIILILHLIKSLKFNKRFDIYICLLKLRNFEIIENLVSYSNMSKKTVIMDLNKAISEKLIPQGHFSRENLVFMVSDEIYDKYMLNPDAYDLYFISQIEERKSMRARTDEINKIIEKGNTYIKKIHDSNVIIKNKSFARQIDKLENIVLIIFHEADADPSQAESLGMFLNYYLPTTEKLLNAYITICEKQVTGKNLSRTKKEIEKSLAAVIVAFENILEKMNEAHKLDITKIVNTKNNSDKK